MNDLNKELKYIKIFNDISKHIETYRLAAGTQLLGVRELMEHYSVSYSTVMRALRLLEKDGFIETIQGRGIFVKSTMFANGAEENNLVGLIVTDMNIPFFSKIIQVLEAELVSRGYNIIIRNSDFNSVIERDIIETFIERGIKGAIIVPTFNEMNTEYLASVDNKLIDITYIIRRKRDYPCNYVISDDYSGGLMATEHLIANGHRKIGYISGAPIQGHDRRFDAFSNVLHQHGIPLRDEWIIYADYFEFSSGYSSMKKLLSLDEKPTALVCYTDSIAGGVMKACREAGYSIPDDLSVVGYNNENITNLVEPNITTIDVPISEICCLAVNSLITKMTDSKMKKSLNQIVLPVKLVRKQSVKTLSNE